MALIDAQLLEIIQQGGAAMAPVGWLLWWLERGERKDAQTELKQIAKDSIVAMMELKSLVGTLGVIFKPPGGNQ